LATGFARLRERIDDNCARQGLAYPWWVPVMSVLGQAACVVSALALRDAWRPELLWLTVVLVLWPSFFNLLLGRLVPWWLEFTSVLVAAVWLLSDPVPGVGSVGTQSLMIDTAPVLLALLTAEVLAREGIRLGSTIAVLSLVTIGVASWTGNLTGGPVHIVDVLLGFVIGGMLRAQMRALAAERAARAGERQRATLAERQRIAREIHDLVAHSLSVTLLHITGARHALSDVDPASPGAEVAEVDAALADAERVGRQAMADIRQTVSTLADGPSETSALPGAADICGLVSQMELAGLSIDYVEEGEPGMLAHATGLGLYRIAQESLANIAKHAPESVASVRFSVDPRRARLTVRNALPGALPGPASGATDSGGSGLDGIRARAAQLGATVAAGPENSEWVVDVRLPLHQQDGQLWCGRTLPGILR
jgi:signal transduction histidine kinase